MAQPVELEAAYEAWVSSAAGSEDERRALDDVMRRAAIQIRRVLSKLFGSSSARFERSDLNDACGDAMLKLYRVMCTWKGSSATRPAVLQAYVNEIARNVFYDLHRARNPAWFSTGSSVLWKMRHSGRFVLSDKGDERLCSLTETVDLEPELDRRVVEAAGDLLRRERDWSRLPIEMLLEALLLAVGKPIPFHMVVDQVLQCMGGERSVRSLDDEIAPGMTLVDVVEDGSNTPEQNYHDAELLQWVWNEMGELPENQRQVCGLNLEAAVGTRLETFVLRGIANKARYDTLIRKLTLAALPGFPPFADPEIGQLIECDAKQVSNARGSAQRRLARQYLKKRKPGAASAARPRPGQEEWRPDDGTFDRLAGGCAEKQGRATGRSL